MICVQEVSKTFGDVRVLDRVNLTVADQTIVAILGPSGIGKSVLLRIMAGLLRPDSGRVLYDGRSLHYHKFSDNQHVTGGIGYVFQAGALFDSMTVEENVALPLQETSRPSVSEVKRRVASAAWWGFDEEDATEALQAAILSGARRLIVPNMRRDWIVRPIRLASELELVLEDGAIITAKRGEYRGRGDSVFTAQDVRNLTVRGYGATIRMHKEDYIVGKVLLDFGWNRWFGQYEKAEWRMTLSLRGCENVRIYGLTLRDSGGDGIYVAGGRRPYSKNVYIRDVVCQNHYRQGISVISAEDLTVENSVFRDTWGTPPSSGVDIEPDSPQERVRN
ncbi:MAG: ATP-binding cassette domain-containing protein, partial [candidate division WOR-3 bacterium]